MMNEFKKIYRKVNGNKVIKDYLSSHVFVYALLNVCILGISRKSLELVRMSVSNKIVSRLRRRYKPFIAQFVKNWKTSEIKERTLSNKVWVCWLQGLDNAPEIVKICYKSLTENLQDRKVVLITEDNYGDWISFPKHIKEKIESGVITKAHLSDLIRLELLEHYGGTWIDATVFCSGGNIPSYLLNSDLFIYQIMKPGLDGNAARTSSWFITSCTNNPIIVLTKELLYEYWKTNKNLVDYFLIHDMIELSIEAFPEEWKNVVPMSSAIPHILLFRLELQYNSNIWDATRKMTPFHKLSWKFSQEQVDSMKKSGTFYDIVLQKNSVF